MTLDVNIARAGDHAVLIEFDRDIAAPDLHAKAHAARSAPGVLACIVGQSSLYVVFTSAFDANVLSKPSTRQPVNPSTHQIKVSLRHDYAQDLSEFLAHTKQTKDEFTKRLADIKLTVRYLGFRGGFAYLDGWPAEWAMPRRTTSRPVARGSFAIAGSVAGFYPIDTPGGWNVLGRTSENVENRFAPGDVITIEATTDIVAGQARAPVLHNFPGIVAPFVTRVARPNWQNLERGLPVGGAFDLEAADAARLAASASHDVFEFAQIGPKVTPDSNVILGWCDMNGVHVQRVRRDETYDFGRIRNGLRGYLAIGDRPGHAAALRRDDRLTIRAIRGPHDIGVTELDCEVTPKLDRIGIRMRPSQKLTAPADLPSIGMQFGSLQLHPDGSIVAMGPDHPVTGGYLQPMTVMWSERWKLAHLTPGERVRFVAVDQL